MHAVLGQPSLDWAKTSELALRHNLPSVEPNYAYARAGGLLAYSGFPGARDDASYVDKILKGAKPADLPIRQPTRFNLVINLKTAKSLGLNRAASINEPKVVAGLDELIPFGNWRAALAEGERNGGLSPEERNEILVTAFSDNLRQIGNYGYVAETAVLRPTKDRPLYSLLYCTRSKTGIEVFRDCQIAALEEQSRTRAAVKIGHAQTTSGQGEIFQSLHEMGPDDLLRYLQSEREAATGRILELIPTHPDTIQYDELWPQILARSVVTKVDVNKIVARLRAENQLLIPDWEKRRRVPQDGYRLQRV